MKALQWETADEINLALAGRFRNIRRRRRISQEKMSQMSGVSLGSLKRFERTGSISLLSLTKLAMALDCADEIRGLFTGVVYRNMDEVLNERILSEVRELRKPKRVGESSRRSGKR